MIAQLEAILYRYSSMLKKILRYIIMSFYNAHELSLLGLKQYGSNILINRSTQIYGPGNISIGNNVRIDAFCILSSGDSPFILEDYIHISAGVYIYGQKGFHMKSFSNISAGSKIYTQTDDFSGDVLIGPTIPINLRNIYSSPITIEKHVIIGAGSIMLPGAILGEGVAIGANSLVKKECKPWSMYIGSPARFLKERSKQLLELEHRVLS